MIKQNFNIDSVEMSRILQMHESATKNHYLIKEQRQPEVITNTETKINKFPTTNLGNKFEYGKYDSPTVKTAIEQLKPQIEKFIQDSDSSNFTINISAGESRVTNPKGFETKGSLADLVVKQQLQQKQKHSVTLSHYSLREDHFQ